MCEGQCHGCALKKGATANGEVDNRITAAIAALGGIPFLCHERLGWKGRRKGYPKRQTGITAAHANLLSAPKLIHDSLQMAQCLSDATSTGVPASMFQPSRKTLGKRPMCQGWRSTVASLASQGWFSDKDLRDTRRAVAKEALRALEGVKEKRDLAIGVLAGSIKWLAAELKRSGVNFEGFK